MSNLRDYEGTGSEPLLGFGGGSNCSGLSDMAIDL